jgi:hypothetical protein
MDEVVEYLPSKQEALSSVKRKKKGEERGRSWEALSIFTHSFFPFVIKCSLTTKYMSILE